MAAVTGRAVVPVGALEPVDAVHADAELRRDRTRVRAHGQPHDRVRSRHRAARHRPRHDGIDRERGQPRIHEPARLQLVKVGRPPHQTRRHRPQANVNPESARIVKLKHRRLEQSPQIADQLSLRLRLSAFRPLGGAVRVVVGQRVDPLVKFLRVGHREQLHDAAVVGRDELEHKRPLSIVALVRFNCDT